MNFALLDKIDTLDEGFMATVVATSGHTYQKAGARALYRGGEQFPCYGNLGALCADRDVVTQGAESLRDGRPRIMRVDTTSPDDALLGYGTACGGTMEILLEPLAADQRDVYRSLRKHLEGSTPVYLMHNTLSGALSIATVEPGPTDGTVVERIDPPRRVVLFGATPLAARLHAVLEGTRFDVHVADWRAAHLDELDTVPASRRHIDDVSLDPHTFAVVLSHSFERDRDILRRALNSGCAFIGVLSSTPRRDQMFEELIAEGVDGTRLARVACPVGIDVPGRTDAEIAVAIAAQLLEVDGT